MGTSNIFNDLTPPLITTVPRSIIPTFILMNSVDQIIYVYH